MPSGVRSRTRNAYSCCQKCTVFLCRSVLNWAGWCMFRRELNVAIRMGPSGNTQRCACCLHFVPSFALFDSLLNTLPLPHEVEKLLHCMAWAQERLTFLCFMCKEHLWQNNIFRKLFLKHLYVKCT